MSITKPYTEIEKPVTKVEELDAVYGNYTYADYLKWELDEMVELIKGKVFKMSPAPSEYHQRISMNLSIEISNCIKNQGCRVYAAPFDVRLPLKGKSDEEVTTVIQPDLCVICDSSKLDQRGCLGAPDLVIEILSPSSVRKDTHEKMEVYGEAEVPEIWLVHPGENHIIIYKLENGSYIGSIPFVAGDIIESKTIPGLEINLAEVFENTDY